MQGTAGQGNVKLGKVRYMCMCPCEYVPWKSMVLLHLSLMPNHTEAVVIILLHRFSGQGSPFVVDSFGTVLLCLDDRCESTRPRECIISCLIR